MLFLFAQFWKKEKRNAQAALELTTCTIPAKRWDRSLGNAPTIEMKIFCIQSREICCYQIKIPLYYDCLHQ